MTIDSNPSLKYEYQEKWKYFLMPILEYPISFWVALKKMITRRKLKTNCFWIDGLSPVCRQIRENATNWRALDTIYNYEPKNGSFVDSLTRFWMENVVNVKAVRNRLKLIKEKLNEAIKEILLKDKEVRIFSIASGSAQALIENISEFKKQNVLIKALFLDLDPTAIKHSRNLAKKFNVLDQINFDNKSAHNIEKSVGDFNPNIIEMVGFLEYRPKEKAIKLIQKIYGILQSGGIFLTSNLRNNSERPFLYFAIDWWMVYRSPEEFAEVLKKGGFSSENFEIIYEPLKIHGVAICKKL